MWKVFMHRNFSFPLLHCYSAMDVLQMQMQHCNIYQNNQDLSLPSGSDILPIYQSCRANAICDLPINLRYPQKSSSTRFVPIFCYRCELELARTLFSFVSSSWLPNVTQFQESASHGLTREYGEAGTPCSSEWRWPHQWEGGRTAHAHRQTQS